MWTSVPHRLVRLTRISTSLGPTSGTGASMRQMPSRGSSFARARIVAPGPGAPGPAVPASALTAPPPRRRPPSSHHPQLPPDADEGVHGALELLARVRRRHLRPDARLTPRHHGVGEPDDVDALL